MRQRKRLIIAILCLAGTLAPTAASRGQSTCNPPTIGSPCALGGPALSPPVEPAINLGAGNPIHLATGNKYQRETDLPAAVGTPDLEIVRHYNAGDRRESPLGRGWSLSYDARLRRVGNTWQIAQPDGSRILFRSARGHPAANQHGRLSPHETGWRWVWPNGRRLTFDARGRLANIRFARGHALFFRRHEEAGPLRGMIAAIAHSGGARFAFHYHVWKGRAYVDRIETPAGAFRYQYEPMPNAAGAFDGAREQRLTALTRPDGMRRHYLYESARQNGKPWLLTGMAIVSADGRHTLRTNTWAYDTAGRAVLSTRGEPGSDNGRITLDYVRAPGPDHDGLTRVTNAAGRESHFTTAIRGGRHVLLRAEGAGCPGCAAPGTTARYDASGRLAEINGTRITRDAGGAIRALAVRSAGWPALVLRYGAGGWRDRWASAATGVENTRFDAAHRPARREFANGDVWAYTYDAQGRPVQVRESTRDLAHLTTLAWRGQLLERVTHPNETEWREYDSKRRLVQRTVERPRGNPSVRYRDAFQYDDTGRLTRHDLPEGGALLYHGNPRGGIRGIDWLDRDGRLHTVIANVDGQPGYRYGNGLTLLTRHKSGRDTDLIVADGGRAVLAEARRHDTQGRLTEEHHGAQAMREIWRYAYDAQGRLAAAQRFTPTRPIEAAVPPESSDHSPAAPASMKSPFPIWYAWRDDGSLAARRDGAGTRRFTVIRDASGLPTQVDDIDLRYGPGRRPLRATRGNTLLATYRHNAFGHRIAVATAQAHTDYLYLDNRVVAEARRPPSASKAAEFSAAGPRAITRRYLYAGHVLVGLIDYDPVRVTDRGTLYAVHTDLLGAPRAVTDERRDVRWLAGYSPTGEATRIAGDLTLDARLPGQMLDPATGWHDNLLRTYHPGMGQYLEPDPLGPLPDNQAFGYAAQRPRQYIDPLGLMLFAFDGTRNSPLTQTNVWKMSQQYLDGPVFYQAGPGSPTDLDWDAVTAYSALNILGAQWDALLDELARPAARNDTRPIDIIGFSRGAALARHFANQISAYAHDGYFSYNDVARGVVTACVDLRFMGLFDTVAQFGLLGTQNANYDLRIAAAWEWVAHAVAIHERRRSFPVVSVGGPNGNTVEAPFIGAHADIGGGVSLDTRGRVASRGDLADVALNWMLWQARAASARFAPPTLDDREITEPILHDQRLPPTRTIMETDRRVDGPDGRQLVARQDDHARLGRAQRATTEALITRIDNWRVSTAEEVGTVDMNGYARWLHDELGWHALPA